MDRNIARNALERTRSLLAFWYVIFVFLSSLFFMLMQGGKLASMIFFVICTVTIYLFIGNWSGIKKSSVTRKLMNTHQTGSIEAGQPLSIQLEVSVPGFWPIPYLFIKDELSRHNGDTYMFEESLFLDFRRKATLTYVSQPLRRGLYQYVHTDCWTEDIWGLFSHRARIANPQSFIVTPQTITIRQWNQYDKKARKMNVDSTTQRSHKESTQINGVREYVYGDRLSRIHWNATAKTGLLKSKEFERESLPRTIVCLDRTKMAYADHFHFELAVSIAASIIRYGANRKNPMSLLSAGSETTYIGTSHFQNQQTDIIQHLITVEADSQVPLYQVMQERIVQFKQADFIIIISPQKGSAIMQILRWLDLRQMQSCYLHVYLERALTDEVPSLDDEWMQQVKSRGYLGYEITQLQDLPKKLGGVRSSV